MHEASGTRFGEAGTDREHVFRAATRHSRFVRFLRGAIPVGLVLIMATILAAPYFKPLVLRKLPLDPSRLGVSGTKITMEAPRLGGFTRDGRPYDLTASAAAQDLRNPDVLDLKEVHAHVEMLDKSVVDIKAVSGTYDTKADMLWLKQDVKVESTAGYAVSMSVAAVDIKKNKIVSDAPVEVKLSNGTVNANRLEVSENGELMRFDNGVVMNIVPQTPAGAADPKAKP
ncbi:MAG TPA: LPS export ABC transporter periplasmic protein LptC [Xanthobacteraceae bacterium]|jgi:lipopolysaccharide export system protein LptC